jgi:SSS family solute:Na+ symporter
MATATVVLLGVVWIPVMRFVANVLYEYLQIVQSLIAPAIAAVFLLGVFSKRVTPAAGYWGLVVGFIIGMLRLVLTIFRNSLPEGTLLARLAAINWLHFCVLLFVLDDRADRW